MQEGVGGRRGASSGCRVHFGLSILRSSVRVVQSIGYRRYRGSSALSGEMYYIDIQLLKQVCLL